MVLRVGSPEPARFYAFDEQIMAPQLKGANRAIPIEFRTVDFINFCTYTEHLIALFICLSIVSHPGDVLNYFELYRNTK